MQPISLEILILCSEDSVLRLVIYVTLPNVFVYQITKVQVQHWRLLQCSLVLLCVWFFCDSLTKGSSSTNIEGYAVLFFFCVWEREEVIMEEGGNNMEVTHENRRENFVPQDVESATRSDMSSGSWRLSVQEFPTLVERRDGGEHGFFNLSSLLHVPSKSSFMNIYIYKRERERTY